MMAKKILLFLALAAMTAGVYILLNTQRPNGDSYTMRELGQLAIEITDDVLDGNIEVTTGAEMLGALLEAIDNEDVTLNRREADIRVAISRVRLDMGRPGNLNQISSFVTTSRNALAGLVNVPDR